MPTKVSPSYAAKSKPELASLFAQLSAIGLTSTVEDRIKVIAAVAQVIQPQRNTNQVFDQDKQTFFMTCGDNLQAMAPNPPINSETQVEINHIQQEADKAASEMRRRTTAQQSSMHERTAERVAQRTLSRMIIFKDCSTPQISSIVEQMTRRHYHNGDTMCTEGELATEFMGKLVVIFCLNTRYCYKYM